MVDRAGGEREGRTVARKRISKCIVLQLTWNKKELEAKHSRHPELESCLKKLHFKYELSFFLLCWSLFVCRWVCQNIIFFMFFASFSFVGFLLPFTSSFFCSLHTIFRLLLLHCFICPLFKRSDTNVFPRIWGMGNKTSSVCSMLTAAEYYSWVVVPCWIVTFKSLAKII